MNYIIAQQKLTTEKIGRLKRNGMDQKNMMRLKKALSVFDKYTDKDLPFLDIGSRDGWFLQQLLIENYKDVQGIDVSLDAVELMRGKSLTVSQADAHDMVMFKNNYFGNVSIIHVLEHCPKPTVVIKEINRVLNKDGVLYVEIPLEETPKTKSAHFSSFMSGNSLLSLFKDGFEMLECNPDPNIILPKSNFYGIFRKI